MNLDIEPYSTSVLVGANGAGKTSLLRFLAGLENLQSGDATVLGIDLARGDRRQLRRRVGWMGHDGSFYDELTVKDNLVFAARALERPLDTIDPALERVGLLGRSSTLASRLSAGQRRRLALAWLLVRRAELWILDEPYASLDESGRHFLDALIRDVVTSGATVVMSSHDPLIDSSLETSTVVMSGGRVASGVL